MGQNISNYALHDFANMLHMNDYGKFAHEAKDTKGVLYLDANNKLCNANRHSASVEIRDTSHEQQQRNLMLRQSLVAALANAGISENKMNDIRTRLGLPPEGATASGERPMATGANPSASTDPVMHKPLERRVVKELITDALKDLSDEAVLSMTTDKLKAMVKNESQVAGRVRQFLNMCENNLADGEKKPILNGNLMSVFSKYAELCEKNAAEISKLGQSKGHNAMIKTALVRNKADFIGNLSFDEAQALSRFCKFGKKALTSYSPSPRLAPNLERLDWKHVEDLFVVKKDELNTFCSKDGAIELDVDDLLSESYYLSKDLGKIRDDAVRHFKSQPKDKASELPEKPVEEAPIEENPADADELRQPDANKLCEDFLRTSCDEHGLLNPDNQEAFRDYLVARSIIPDEKIDSYVVAWKILTRSENVNGKYLSGAAANPRLREQLQTAAETIMADAANMSPDQVNARLMQAVLDEITSIAGLMKDHRLVDRLDEIVSNAKQVKDDRLVDENSKVGSPGLLFETLSVHYNMDPVVSTYNALMMASRAERIGADTIGKIGVRVSESDGQWNFPCKNKTGKQIVVTKDRASKMIPYESSDIESIRSKDHWYSKWGLSVFEKAAFYALQDAGLVDKDLSIGVPLSVTDAFQLFGLGQPEIFGQDGEATRLADVLRFAHEAQRALIDGRPCVLRQDGHCYPVVAVDLCDPSNPKIRVAERLIASNSTKEFFEKTLAFERSDKGLKSLGKGFEIFVSKEVPRFEETTVEAPIEENPADADEVISTTLNGSEKSDHHYSNLVEDDGEDVNAVSQENKSEAARNNEPQNELQETSQQKADPQPVEPQQVANQPVANQPAANSGTKQSCFNQSWAAEAITEEGRDQRKRIIAFHESLTIDERQEVERIFNSRKKDNLASVKKGHDLKSDYVLWQESYCELVLRGFCMQGEILDSENEKGFRDYLLKHHDGLTMDDQALVDAWKIMTKREQIESQSVPSTYRDMILWTGLQTITEKITTPGKNATGDVTPKTIVDEMKAEVLKEISKIADAMKEPAPVTAKNFPQGKDFTRHYKTQAPHGNTCPIISTVNAMLSSNDSKTINVLMKPVKSGKVSYYEFPYRHEGKNVRVTMSEINQLKINKTNQMVPFSDFEKAVYLALQKTGLLGRGESGEEIHLGDVFEVGGVFRLFGMKDPTCCGKPSDTMMNSEVLQHAHEALKALRAGQPCVLRQGPHFRAITGVNLKDPDDPKITVVESIGTLPTQQELTLSKGELRNPFQIYIP